MYIYVIYIYIYNCRRVINVPWVVCGDYNATFAMGDKTYRYLNLVDIRLANNFVHDLGLQEPPTFGSRFTRTNGQVDVVWVKLDRFLVNNTWAANFPRMIQNCLPGWVRTMFHLDWRLVRIAPCLGPSDSS